MSNLHSPSTTAHQILATYTSVSKRLGGQLSIHGISLTEYLIMHELVLAPGKSLTSMELAQQVRLSPSGVTRLLKPMEKNLLIGKTMHPRDARKALVQLTSTGERVYTEAQQSFADTSAQITRLLSSKEITALHSLLATLS